MKYKAVAALGICFFLGASAFSGEIKVIYPSEGDVLPFLKSTFIFGSVNPSTAPFMINGQSVKPYTNGGFLAFLPVTEGDFAFNCILQAETTAYYSRRFKVSPNPQPVPPPDAVKLDVLSPTADMELSPGDFLTVQAFGTPRKKAVFFVPGISGEFPMRELPENSGRYAGMYRINDFDSAKKAEIFAKFKTGFFSSSAKAKAKGLLTVLKTPFVLETSTDAVILRNSTDAGMIMFLPKGVKLLSDGRSGSSRRIKLSAFESAWVEDSKVIVSPSSPFLPYNETSSIRIKKTDTGASATISMMYPAPYIVEEKENSLRLTLYYIKQHTNWVIYDSSDTLIKQVRFFQSAENNVTIDFELNTAADLGGYEVLAASKSMTLDLRQVAAASGVWPKPLGGIRVILDPGHSSKLGQGEGAVGPLGTLEPTVNLALAYKLKESLTTLGADVVLTRLGDEVVPLYDRPKIAREQKGNLYISLHNNGLPFSEDPFAAKRGFSIYYYHRHSMPFARAVHRAYLANIPLADEGLRFGDYAVVRMTSMPAILTETAYLMFPEQEELLNTPAFQQKVADTITKGVLDFFKVKPQPVVKVKKSIASKIMKPKKKGKVKP